jgi:hypothetical protein
MSPHEALPQLPMIWNKEMQQFVNDHIVSDFSIKNDQLSIKVEIATGGT